VDAKGLDHAKRALSKAKAAFERMSNPDEDTLDAWEDFLQASGRFYAKMKEASKGHPKSWKWFGARLDERESDELLSYIHHARNIDQLGIVEIVSDIQGRLNITPIMPFDSDVLEMEVILTPDGATIRTSSGDASQMAHYSPPYIKLEGVWDRIPGTKDRKFYNVPKRHLEKDIGLMMQLNAQL
jgi:hypothetical protein